MEINEQISLDYKAPGSFEETRYEKLHNVIFENSKVGESCPTINAQMDPIDV